MDALSNALAQGKKPLLTMYPQAPTVIMAAAPVAAPMVRRALSGPVLEAYNQDPTTAAVKSMQEMATDSSPAKGGWGEALARVLAGGLGGYMKKKEDAQYQTREQARQDVLQKALMGQDPEQTLRDLASNPDTSDLALTIRQKQMEKMAEMQAQANTPITPYQRAQLASENIVDTAGNIVPKYRQDVLQQFLTPSGFPVQAGGSGTPGAMLPQPAAAGGNPPAPQANAPAFNGMVPKAQVAGQEQVAKNLADIAAPEAGKNDVENLTSTLSMLQDANELNKVAYGGMVQGPAAQMVGRILGDSMLEPGERQARDAYSQLSQRLQAVAAEAVKPLFGSAQLSDADREAARIAASVPVNYSRQERQNAIDQISEIIQRKRDLAALNQKAAQEGRTVSPDEINAYYASRGVDYASGKKLGAPTMMAQQPTGGQTLLPPPSGQGTPDTSLFTTASPSPAMTPAAMQPTGNIAAPKSEAEFNALPKGTRFVAPDGSMRVKP